ncbi:MULTISPECIES: dihydrofolate reductase family protein [Olivibacter]|uniref:Dihydrofolate reductase family protein n=1 Tax=Olivibacter jilunii TaxID=985016 RepID=A0ABW6B425_9SPHI|nr:hypothetical protein [Olivibacter sp. LS-1]MDX3914884.1 hypothetical protein [Pseudosphingobacterium sp.]QEL03503.1 hypothetical protein FKG96_22605 [Olivibacter sp. LS-1]
MKIIIVANIAANGKVLVSDHPHHQLPQETMDFYLKLVNQIGNLVIGARTFENFEKFPDHVKALFKNVEIVVLADKSFISSTYPVVNKPTEAIDYFSKKGFTEIAIGGGTGTFNAFLEGNFVTDIYFNISPIITAHGGSLGTDNSNLNLRFKLAGSELRDNSVQLHLIKS